MQNQPQPKYEPGYVNPNQQIIIQYDPQQGQVQHHLQRIEIVQPDQQQQVIHYTAQPHHHQQQQQYVIVPQSSMVQQQQQQQRTSGGSSIQHQQRNTFNENIDGEEVDERILLQRARRAERARRK